MIDNKTLYVLSLPSNKRAIGCGWIHKNKFHFDGSLSRQKSRLIAKGYNQQARLYCLDTFSPVAKLVTMKPLLRIGILNN